jgi:3-oxoacyl-ACP reductase-like protein
MTESDEALRPAYRRDRRAEPVPEPSAPEAPAEPAPAPAPPAAVAAPDIDDADLERGRTLAVIAAIGRLQMSVDVLARQQKKHQEAVEARLARIERALTENS